MNGMTTGQRMLLLDDVIAAIGAEAQARPSRAADDLLRDLGEYRSWNDEPPLEAESFVLAHDMIARDFARLFSATEDADAVEGLLHTWDQVQMLEDSVPSGGAKAWVSRQFSVLQWADRIDRMPRGALRDIAAYALDNVHASFGRHDSGFECRIVADLFPEAEEESAVGRVLHWASWHRSD